MSDSWARVSSRVQGVRDSWMDIHLHADLLVDAVLLVPDILLELLEGSCVWGGAVGLKYCDVSEEDVSGPSPAESSYRCQDVKATYSSVRGVIFFSGSSSSAKFFLYFSQFSPVALGMMTVLTA